MGRGETTWAHFSFWKGMLDTLVQFYFQASLHCVPHFYFSTTPWAASERMFMVGILFCPGKYSSIRQKSAPFEVIG